MVALWSGFAASAQSYTPSETVIVERIKWIYKVKEFAARKTWPDFANQDKQVGLAYFTDSCSYIVDPAGILQKRIKTVPFYKNDSITILRTKTRIDDRPFHMETMMETKDRSAIFFNHPVMCCSDYEGTVKNLPQVSSLQEWASMIVHEYFHGFQLVHRATASYGDDSVQLRGSQLDGFYKADARFRSSADQENELLLSCLQTGDRKKTDSLLKQFKRLRETRRALLEDQFKNNFAAQENFYEKLEGTAKYVEIGLIRSFKQFPVDQRLLKIDTAYKAAAYRNFDLTKEKWMYETGGSMHYFYATGFNLLRVLDKLRIPYKKNFFDDNKATPYTLLENYIKKVR